MILCHHFSARSLRFPSVKCCHFISKACHYTIHLLESSKRDVKNVKCHATEWTVLLWRILLASHWKMWILSYTTSRCMQKLRCNWFFFLELKYSLSARRLLCLKSTGSWRIDFYLLCTANLDGPCEVWTELGPRPVHKHWCHVWTLQLGAWHQWGVKVLLAETMMLFTAIIFYSYIIFNHTPFKSSRLVLKVSWAYQGCIKLTKNTVKSVILWKHVK